MFEIPAGVPAAPGCVTAALDRPAGNLVSKSRPKGLKTTHDATTGGHRA